MTIMTYRDPRQDVERDDDGEYDRDLVVTRWLTPTPECLFCGQQINDGDHIWHWHQSKHIVAHVSCIKLNLRGIMKDFAECLR